MIWDGLMAINLFSPLQLKNWYPFFKHWDIGKQASFMAMGEVSSHKFIASNDSKSR